MAKSRPERKPDPPPATRILPMQLRVGDRLVEATGEWEIVATPTRPTQGRTSTCASAASTSRTSPRSGAGPRTSGSRCDREKLGCAALQHADLERLQTAIQSKYEGRGR